MEVNFREVKIDHFLAFLRWLGLEAESQLIKLSLRHELSFANKHVAIELFRHAKLIVKTELYALKAWLHSSAKRLHDQTVQVRVIILDDGGRATPCLR